MLNDFSKVVEVCRGQVSGELVSWIKTTALLFGGFHYLLETEFCGGSEQYIGVVLIWGCFGFFAVWSS